MKPRTQHLDLGPGLIVRALLLALWYRFTRRRRGFGELLTRSRPVGGARRAPRYDPFTIRRAVGYATRLPLLRSTCLVRSAVLTRMLREEGHAAVLVIGVSEAGVRERWFAHAWVDLSTDPAVAEGYREIVRLVP